MEKTQAWALAPPPRQAAKKISTSGYLNEKESIKREFTKENKTRGTKRLRVGEVEYENPYQKVVKEKFPDLPLEWNECAKDASSERAPVQPQEDSVSEPISTDELESLEKDVAKFKKQDQIDEGFRITSLHSWKNMAEKKWRADHKGILSKEKRDKKGYYEIPNERWTKGTWINADVRYLNLSSLGGNFDIIYMDPPWKIGGTEKATAGKTMFSNADILEFFESSLCKIDPFVLAYNTLSQEEILDLDIGSLSSSGFIFLWTINSRLPLALKCMKKWGYQYVDKIVWVKKTSSDKIHVGQGFYFLHSTELCLVGIKKDDQNQFIHKVSTDLIFAEVRKNSRKPDELYHIMESLVPGGRKIEIFARNHNIRPGWLSIGNQLGEYYDWDKDAVWCDECGSQILTGQTRYKSKLRADSDLCEKCFKTTKVSIDEYIEMDNLVTEMAFHEFFSCNNCSCTPIPGNRFSCCECKDYDLCEACYDKPLQTPDGSIHKMIHKFAAIEIPQLAGGLPVHRVNCTGCGTFPVIGYLFSCRVCSAKLCQKCFFLQKEPGPHLKNHEISIETVQMDIYSKCDVCKLDPIIGTRYKCKECVNYDLCETCFLSGALMAPNEIWHKPTHSFTKIE